MPKEPSSRQFRKGTKSCIECRQRKLRCIPAEDESQPCQNCKERGRSCVLQTEVGRSSDVVPATSRDRITQLEDEVGKLWSVVGELRTELGHKPQNEETPYALRKAWKGEQGAETESEMSDISPMNPPTHLQVLFDNEFLDSHGHDMSDMSSEKASSTMINRARNRLQALLPPKEDVRQILMSAGSWLTLYNALFPTITMFTHAQEMLAKYESLQGPDANPMSVASLLISISITVVQRPDPHKERSGIKDPATFVRKVSEAVEETIVSNDQLAGTLEGIETSLLYIRLQLVRVQTRTLWLKLRHIIALAELIGLPRAASKVTIPDAMSPSLADFMRSATRLESAAVLWKSICTVDRFIGTMFNLPLGTAAYAFQLPKRIISDEGSVITQSFMAHLANIGCRIQEIDEAYIAQVPETELLERVFKADQELRSLGQSTPSTWWSLPPGSGMPDQLEQYWFHYFTARVHLQLALRNSDDSQYIYSYLACSQACRTMAVRYVNLRGMLPAAFFAGRVLDLQALTAAIFLLFSSKRPNPQQGLGVQLDGGDQPSTALVERIIETMDSISTQPSGDFGKQAATAIRALRSLLEKGGKPDSKNLTLRIPMLGKINVNRHHQPNANYNQNSQGQQQQQYDVNPLQPTATNSNPNLPPLQQVQAPVQNDNYDMPAMDSNGLLSWSLDLMMDDLPPFPDNNFGADQWLSWDTQLQS